MQNYSVELKSFKSKEERLITFSVLTTPSLHFIDYLRNSLLISGISAFFCVLIAALAAYSITRLPLPHKTFILFFVIAVSMFPQISLMSYLFKFMTEVPEDIQINIHKVEQGLKGKIDLIEALGREKLLRISVGAHRLSSLTTSSGFREGEAVNVEFNLEKLHVFGERG